MDLGIAERAAIVTGGSSGIGKAIAHGLSREGVRVAICARHMDALEAAAREIEGETGTEVLPMQADVTRIEDVERCVETTLARFGHVDILVNNASSSTTGNFFQLSDEDWMNHLNVKLLGCIRFVRAVAPLMKERGWGRIINIGGGAARHSGNYGWKAGAIHAGIDNLSKRLSDELGPFGITVNVVDPGGVWTEGRTMDATHIGGTGGESRAQRRESELRRSAEQAGISRDEMEQRVLAEIPIRRFIKAEDSAHLIAFLVSDLASAITGQVVATDGGKPRGINY